MKICIIGAGAIGGVIACRLAASGHAVSVVARGAHLDAIVARGLTMVDHLDGRATSTAHVAASADPADHGPQDVVVIGLKAHAIPAMLDRIAPLLRPDTIVVPAINGLPWWYFQRDGSPHEGTVVRAVDPQGTMAAALDAGAIVGCVVHIAAEVREPGVVHHTGGRHLIVGEIDRSLAEPVTPRVEALRAALDAAGFETKASKDVRYDVWAKLIGNLSFNPVAALTYADMGRICADEPLLDVIRAMLVEGMAVARAYGVTIAMTPDERIDVARHLGAARISMHQDFEAHRKPEIEAIVGSVIELAERAGIAAPTARMMRALVVQRAVSEGLMAG